MARDSRKVGQSGKIMKAARVTMLVKNLVRLVAASRAACHGGSSRSRTECHAKASRLKAAITIARNCLPWPKLCSSS